MKALNLNLENGTCRFCTSPALIDKVVCWTHIQGKAPNEQIYTKKELV